MRRGHSVMSMFLAFVWAFLIVCSDDMLVYADFHCQESIALSSVILDGEDVWSESSTDYAATICILAQGCFIWQCLHKVVLCS